MTGGRRVGADPSIERRAKRLPCRRRLGRLGLQSDEPGRAGGTCLVFQSVER